MLHPHVNVYVNAPRMGRFRVSVSPHEANCRVFQSMDTSIDLETALDGSKAICVRSSTNPDFNFEGEFVLLV